MHSISFESVSEDKEMGGEGRDNDNYVDTNVDDVLEELGLEEKKKPGYTDNDYNSDDGKKVKFNTREDKLGGREGLKERGGVIGGGGVGGACPCAIM